MKRRRPDVNSIAISCPGCGARIDLNDTVCEYCGGPVVITSFHSLYGMPVSDVNRYRNGFLKNQSEYSGGSLSSSLGMCSLRLKLYDKALSYFEDAIRENVTNSETYFYAAVSLLGGKKAFLAKREVIDQVISYVDAAIILENRGIYHYYLAYIKYDYFERKYLNKKPDYKECLQKAAALGTSEFDKKMLFDLLGVERPSKLNMFEEG